MKKNMNFKSIAKKCHRRQQRASLIHVQVLITNQKEEEEAVAKGMTKITQRVCLVEFIDSDTHIIIITPYAATPACKHSFKCIQEIKALASLQWRIIVTRKIIREKLFFI